MNTKPRGVDRTKQIYAVLAEPEDSVQDKVNKLDKVNERFIDIRVDLYMLQTRISKAMDNKYPTDVEKAWLQKANFALNKMMDDHQRLESNRDRLMRSIEVVAPQHAILATCVELEAEVQEYIVSLSDPAPRHVSRLEKDFPSSIVVTDFTEEEPEDVINMFIEDDDEDVMEAATEVDVHKQMYDAFFVAHARKELDGETFARIAAMSETSYEVYLDKHCG